MGNELQDRFTKASERFANSLTNLTVFTGNKVADLLERTVETVERTVNNITGETSSASKSGGSTATRTATSTTRSTKRTKRTSRTKASGGRSTITEAVQAKIREGFDRGMTTKEIAKFAGVSQSSAVRYTAPLRTK